MAISQVITFGGSPEQLVWKYGDENITTTSKLIVDETHEALLVVNGNAADLFGPGSHTLSLPNIPLLNKITTIPTGGVNPFPCKVFYVNKVHHLELMWGTQSPITMEDPDYQIFIHVMLHGNISVSVGDSRKFLLKLVGFRSGFTTDDIVANFKSQISVHVKDVISQMMINQRVGYFTMNANLMSVSKEVQARLESIFDEYGVVVHYFNIEGIDVPDKDYATIKAAKERRAGRIIEGFSWRDQQQMEIAKTFAGNQGAMGAMGGMMGGFMGGAMMGGTISELTRNAMSADTMGNPVPPHDVRSAGAGLGIPNANAMQGMVDIGRQAGPAQTETAPRPAGGSFCPECGSPVSAGQKFCPECGKKLTSGCPSCGAPVEPNAKFCAQCGHRL